MTHPLTQRRFLTVLLSLGAMSVATAQQKPSPAPAAPIGAVIAFAGPIGAIPGGWELADGRPMAKTDEPELFAVLGTSYGDGVDESGTKLGDKDFNLPDYRGVFLRGVDLSEAGNPSGRDPDAAARLPRNATSNRGNAVGSIQTAATARPTATAFTTDAQGAHSHQLLVETNASRNPNNNPCCFQTVTTHHVDGNARTSVDGAHGHNVLGGDSETRPINVSVYWIIRAR